jgi:hypothetical protein
MFGVPPPLVRKDLIAQMRGEAETLLPPQYLDCLRHIDQPFFTPVYDFCSPTMAFSRAALGRRCLDAASPHRFGVSKAGAEAQALAEALSNYDELTEPSRPTTRPAGRSVNASFHTAVSSVRNSRRGHRDRRGPQDGKIVTDAKGHHGLDCNAEFP